MKREDENLHNPVDTRRRLNVYQTSIRRRQHRIDVLQTLKRRRVSTGKENSEKLKKRTSLQGMVCYAMDGFQGPPAIPKNLLGKHRNGAGQAVQIRGIHCGTVAPCPIRSGSSEGNLLGAQRWYYQQRQQDLHLVTSLGITCSREDLKTTIERLEMKIMGRQDKGENSSQR